MADKAKLKEALKTVYEFLMRKIDEEPIRNTTPEWEWSEDIRRPTNPICKWCPKITLKARKKMNAGNGGLTENVIEKMIYPRL